MISTRYFQVLCNIGKGLSKSVKLVFLSEKLDLRDIKRSDQIYKKSSLGVFQSRKKEVKMNKGSEKQRDRDEKVVETSSSESKHHFGYQKLFYCECYFFLIKSFTPYSQGTHTSLVSTADDRCCRSVVGSESSRGIILVCNRIG